MEWTHWSKPAQSGNPAVSKLLGQEKLKDYQGRTNPALSKPCLGLSDTRHFRHFRHFRGSEERSPCLQWVECKFVIFAVFVKAGPFFEKQILYSGGTDSLEKFTAEFSASAPVVYKNPPPVGAEILYTTGAGARVKVSVAISPSSGGGGVWNPVSDFLAGDKHGLPRTRFVPPRDCN